MASSAGQGGGHSLDLTLPPALQPPSPRVFEQAQLRRQSPQGQELAVPCQGSYLLPGTINTESCSGWETLARSSERLSPSPSPAETTLRVPLTDDNQDHTEELNPRTQERAEDHRILRGPEDVSMHQFPARFLHGIFL